MAAVRRYRRRLRRADANPAVPRYLRDRSNPLEDFGDVDFRQRYRFSKQTVADIAQVIVLGEDPRGPFLPAILQVCAFLLWAANGCFFRIVADVVGVHRASMSRIVFRVSRGLVALAPRWISMPVGDARRRTREAFFAVAGFPRVIGAVDGTHIRIQAPSDQLAHPFRDRKGHFSINTQIICDSKYRILDVNAASPGSMHDARVFRRSRVHQEFENGEYGDSILIGDSGYGLKNYLMTPFLRLVNAAQERFNAALRRTRVIVEQTIGILKRRFNCLHAELRLQPARACQVIVACAVLHNIAIERNDWIEDLPPEVPPEEQQDPPPNHDATGTAVRNGIVANYF